MTLRSMASYDSHPSPDSFRESYYGVVYRHAFKVTGSDQPAKKLADRVFKELERRHANNPISGHIDAYLAAQVYLSYAQKGLGDSDEGIEYEDTLPEAEKVSRMGNPPEAAPAIQVSQMPDSPALARESSAWENVSAEVAPIYETISAAAPTEPPRTADIRIGISESPSAFASAPRGAKYYDRNSTIFWTPGLDTASPSQEEPAEELPDFEFPKPPLVRHSVFFSILNGLLALCCVAAIVFLLVELKILPELF